MSVMVSHDQCTIGRSQPLPVESTRLTAEGRLWSRRHCRHVRTIVEDNGEVSGRAGTDGHPLLVTAKKEGLLRSRTFDEWDSVEERRAAHVAATASGVHRRPTSLLVSDLPDRVGAMGARLLRQRQLTLWASSEA